MPMAITESPYLVALSILIATVASYAALDLGGRVTAARGRARPMWLAAAAVTIGGGIWSTHVIGMLAALVMGLAISGMHYAVTRATIVSAHVSVHEFQGISSLDPTSLALVVANVTFLILAVALIASLADQNRAERALRETQAELNRV